jgi:FAD/FMN-containing dehydrogenase
MTRTDELTVDGPVLRPGDDGYAAEVGGFQTAYRHRPDVVVGATGAGDVVAAVRYAGGRGLPVGVQATGHGLGTALDGGVLVSTRRMTGVRVDAGRRSAWVEAGVVWQAVIEATAPYGLAPLAGSAPEVGAVAYTLGGGLGLLARKYGYAADHVRRMEVVTADGMLREVDAEREPELFWGLRGGRDNLGIVTGLEIGLVPVERVWGGGLYFDAPLAGDVVEAYRAWTAGGLPEELTSSVGLVPMPDVEAVPAPLRGRHVTHVRIAYLGDPGEGARLVAPLRAVGPRLIDSLGELPYIEGGTIYRDPTFPHPYRGSNTLLRELDAGGLAEVLRLAGPGSERPAVLDLRHLGGALGRPAVAPSAIGHRDASYLLRIISVVDESTVEGIKPFHDRVLSAAGESLGSSLNFYYGPTTAAEVAAAYDDGDHQRLAGLKARFDPDNTFRANHNIRPGSR